MIRTTQHVVKMKKVSYHSIMTERAYHSISRICFHETGFKTMNFTVFHHIQRQLSHPRSLELIMYLNSVIDFAGRSFHGD